MTAADRQPDSESMALAVSLQEATETLRRLEAVCSSLLSAVERIATVPMTMDGDRTTQTTPPCSVHRSVRSENGTGDGVHNLLTEDVISFLEASEMVPTHPSVSTISAWCSSGCRGKKLESALIGGRRKTTRQAVERFLNASSK